MNLLLKANLFVVTLLAITAGIPKLARIPGEVAFFESLGLGDPAVVVFGFVQVASGVLLIPRVSRMWGAVAAGVTFLASSVMLLLSARIVFGLASVVPALLAGLIWKEAASSNTPQGSG